MLSSRSSRKPCLNAAGNVETVADLAPDAFLHRDNGDREIIAPLELARGRYLCRMDFDSERTDTNVYMGVDTDLGTILRYHGNTSNLSHNFRDMLFTLHSPARVRPFLRYVAEPRDPDLRWHGVRVQRFPAFDGLKPPIIY